MGGGVGEGAVCLEVGAGELLGLRLELAWTLVVGASTSRATASSWPASTAALEAVLGTRLRFPGATRARGPSLGLPASRFVETFGLAGGASTGRPLDDAESEREWVRGSEISGLRTVLADPLREWARARASDPRRLVGTNSGNAPSLSSLSARPSSRGTQTGGGALAARGVVGE